MLKNLCLIIICFLLFVFIASCDKTETPSTAVDSANENILRFDVAAPFTSLNPSEVEASGSTVIFPLLYSYLFVPDINGNLKPDLAESWIYDPETFTWIIHLRTDAFFHNGQPVTSKDVKYSIETTLRKLRPALLEPVKEISIISDSSLSFHLNKNDPGFLIKIWDVEIISILDKGLIDYYEHPIGSGPFKFNRRNNDQQVVLTVNKIYYGDSPSLDGVIFYYQPDKEKSWTRLLSGATDIAQEISPKNFEIMRQYEELFYFDHHALSYYSILLYNTNDPLFSDPTVRQALTHAIDRDYIVKDILHGYGKVAVGPMGIDSPYHNPELTPIPYDPQKSLELLRQAGWLLNRNDHYLYKEQKRFEFNLLTIKESQIEKKIVQYFKLCLNDIGIKMKILSVPYDEFTQRYINNNEFQAMLTEFTGIYRRPEYLKELWSPYFSDKSEAGGFVDAEVTYMINKAIIEKDPIQQKVYLHRIDSQIASLQPGTFLFHKTAIDVLSKRFYLPSLFSLSHEGIYRLQFASLSKN